MNTCYIKLSIYPSKGIFITYFEVIFYAFLAYDNVFYQYTESVFFSSQLTCAVLKLTQSLSETSRQMLIFLNVIKQF